MSEKESVESYLARGGVIQQCERGESASKIEFKRRKDGGLEYKNPVHRSDYNKAIKRVTR